MAPPLAPEGDDRGDRDEECAGQRHRHDEQNVGDPHVVWRGGAPRCECARAAAHCGSVRPSDHATAGVAAADARRAERVAPPRERARRGTSSQREGGWESGSIVVWIEVRRRAPDREVTGIHLYHQARLVATCKSGGRGMRKRGPGSPGNGRAQTRCAALWPGSGSACNLSQNHHALAQWYASSPGAAHAPLSTPPDPDPLPAAPTSAAAPEQAEAPPRWLACAYYARAVGAIPADLTSMTDAAGSAFASIVRSASSGSGGERSSAGGAGRRRPTIRAR